MFAAVCLDSLLGEFMRLIVGFSVNGGRDLLEKLPFDVRGHKFVERQKLRLYLVETKVVL